MVLDNVLGRNCSADAVKAMLGRSRDAQQAQSPTPYVAVALYDVSLASGDASAKCDDAVAASVVPGARDSGSQGRRWGGGVVEVAQLEALGRSLVALGVRLVACQRLIHPWLQRYLHVRGVLALERLSIRHIGTRCTALRFGPRVPSASVLVCRDCSCVLAPSEPAAVLSVSVLPRRRCCAGSDGRHRNDVVA